MIGRLFAGVGLVVCLWLACVGSAVASFGFSSVSFAAVEAPAGERLSEFEELGGVDTRAGSHPWAVKASFVFNTTGPEGGEYPDGDAKDVLVELPPGLVGNSTAIPQCSIKAFEHQAPSLIEESAYEFEGDSCPVSTQVGTADVQFRQGGPLHNGFFNLYNLVPPPGSPAQFGISPQRIPIIIRPTVRTGSDYGLTVGAENLTQFERLGGSSFTFWGTPADPSHDSMRGECLGYYGESLQSEPHDSFHHCSLDSTPVAFLTMPTSCSGKPLSVLFVADSWQHPGRHNADGTPDLSDPNWVTKEASMPPMEGCNRLSFAPKLTASADTSSADSPAGLTVEVKSTQDGLINPVGTAASAIGDATVSLPAGFAINPGQAAGLAACQPSQDGVGSDVLPSCPSASKVGVVQITSPLLPDILEGDAYVLQSNPPDLQLLISAAADGVNVKLIANVHLDEGTGQITTTLSDLPPLPVSDFKLTFSGGAQAALATPAVCGSYTTQAVFTPSSSPFVAELPYSSTFAINSGPGGSACALPFAPVIKAGATTDEAGGYTGFTLLLERGDGQQRIGALQFKAPPGLLARVGGVPLCEEPQAAAGTCSAVSQIGHTVVTAGPGPYPLVVPEPGRPEAAIYLTGPYRGAPFGLSIVVPVVVGPFDLGRQVVRASIAVDPRTTQLTITTDPVGSAGAIPTILHGIPTDLRKIDAVIDRPGFMFNPTNCSNLTFSGTATSTEDATSALSTRFRVGACQSLLFKPVLKVSTSAKTSRKNGASLTAKVTFPNPPTSGQQATLQSNISSFKIDLPKQLPARLTTLQKACLSSVFEANPAACPAGSLIGHAVVHTPVLPVPLTGPVYFVSHGGEAFPNLVFVLQGYGVTINVVSTTFISKTGVLSSTFKTVPDAPFTSFEVTLPTGPFSALTANGNLCKSKLAVPTAYNAQNGLVIHQSTPVTTTSCPKIKKKPAKKKTTAKKTSQTAKSNGRTI